MDTKYEFDTSKAYISTWRTKVDLETKDAREGREEKMRKPYKEMDLVIEITGLYQLREQA